MRIEAYLRVVGDEGEIRSVHAETNLPNASMQRLKAPKGISGAEFWWTWQTERTNIDTYNSDRDLRALLEAHRSIFPVLKKRGSDSDVYLEVVTQYEEGEAPQGLYLSSETIQLLCEVGAALDNDVVIACPGKVSS